MLAVLAAVVFQGQALPPCALRGGKPAGAASCFTREVGEVVIWHAVAPGVFVKICRSDREVDGTKDGSGRRASS